MSRAKLVWALPWRENEGEANVFDKPNEQRQACLGFAMARKRRQRQDWRLHNSTDNIPLALYQLAKGIFFLYKMKEDDRKWLQKPLYYHRSKTKQWRRRLPHYCSSMSLMPWCPNVPVTRQTNTKTVRPMSFSVCIYWTFLVWCVPHITWQKQIFQTFEC